RNNVDAIPISSCGTVAAPVDGVLGYGGNSGDIERRRPSHSAQLTARTEESPRPPSHNMVPAKDLARAARWGRAPTSPIHLNAADRPPVLVQNLEMPLVQSGSLYVCNGLAR